MPAHRSAHRIGRWPLDATRCPLAAEMSGWTHSACALIILAAGAWAFAGAGIWELTPLYIGEVVSVWAFAASWLVAGFYLTAPYRPGTSVEARDHGTAAAAASATNQ